MILSWYEETSSHLWMKYGFLTSSHISHPSHHISDLQYSIICSHFDLFYFTFHSRRSILAPKSRVLASDRPAKDVSKNSLAAKHPMNSSGSTPPTERMKNSPSPWRNPTAYCVSSAVDVTSLICLSKLMEPMRSLWPWTVPWSSLLDAANAAATRKCPWNPKELRWDPSKRASIAVCPVWWSVMDRVLLCTRCTLLPASEVRLLYDYVYDNVYGVFFFLLVSYSFFTHSYLFLYVYTTTLTQECASIAGPRVILAERDAARLPTRYFLTISRILIMVLLLLQRLLGGRSPSHDALGSSLIPMCLSSPSLMKQAPTTRPWLLVLPFSSMPTSLRRMGKIVDLIVSSMRPTGTSKYGGGWLLILAS